MYLSDTACRNAKPKTRPYKISDGHGLYLEIAPSGSKWWRLKYRFGGKENRISLGVYPTVSLKEAREKREAERKRLADGVDPSRHRQMQRSRSKEAAANSFQAIALEWITKFSSTWVDNHTDKVKRRLERDVFPWLGSRPVTEITSAELLSVLRRIESRGARDTAHRAGQNCGQVFRYAIATGRAQNDPSFALRGALPPAKHSHYASIREPAAIGKLMRDIRECRGLFQTQCALRLAPYVFVRPGELRWAEWSEFDLEIAEWRIPAHKMKMRRAHVVPLSAQALEILRELQPMTGDGQYLFPGTARGRPISENTISLALKDLGYAGDQMTVHGFRSMASTLLNEQGWPRDAIERQLAHGERNRVRASYNFAEYLPERRKMMQAWADYLDALRDERKVIVGSFGRAA